MHGVHNVALTALISLRRVVNQLINPTRIPRIQVSIAGKIGCGSSTVAGLPQSRIWEFKANDQRIRYLSLGRFLLQELHRVTSMLRFRALGDARGSRRQQNVSRQARRSRRQQKIVDGAYANAYRACPRYKRDCRPLCYRPATWPLCTRGGLGSGLESRSNFPGA